MTDAAPGPATRFSVAVESPSAVHEVSMPKLEGVARSWRQEPGRAGGEGAAAEILSFTLSRTFPEHQLAMRLSAVVPALRRTGHPFAVSSSNGAVTED
jgi:hypothetical protein